MVCQCQDHMAFVAHIIKITLDTWSLLLWRAKWWRLVLLRVQLSVVVSFGRWRYDSSSVHYNGYVTEQAMWACVLREPLWIRQTRWLEEISFRWEEKVSGAVMPENVTVRDDRYRRPLISEIWPPVPPSVHFSAKLSGEMDVTRPCVMRRQVYVWPWSHVISIFPVSFARKVTVSSIPLSRVQYDLKWRQLFR